MEDLNSRTEQQTTNIQIPTTDSIANRRPLIPTSFALAIILFFFTFFELRCGGEKVESIKGVNLVTGKVLKGEDFFGGNKNDEKIPANFWAILSFGAAVVGLGTFLIKEKREALIGTGAGAIGFVSLLILQFDIKSKIDKQTEGQVDTVSQFPYWLALIALGVAGIISYLRMKKGHQIIASSSPPFTAITPPSENVSQTQPSVSSIPKTSSFDIGKWLNKNKHISLSLVGLAVLSLGIYYIFLKHYPGKDGKKAASAYCDCGKNQNEQTRDAYKKFIADFESSKYSGRDEAQQRLSTLMQPINDISQKCNIAYQEKLTKLNGRYAGDRGKNEKFNYAYSTQLALCNNTDNELGSLYNQVANKINQYVGPVEIEQRRQDSIAEVRTAEIAAQQEAEAKEFPTSGEITVRKSEPGKAWLDPMKTYIRPSGHVKYVFANDLSRIFYNNTDGELSSEKYNEWLNMPAGKYLIYSIDKDNISFKWWQ